MKILIVAALKNEIEPTKNYLTQNKIQSFDFTFLKTSVGKIEAKYNIKKELKRNKYDFVLNIGSAGAINESLNYFDVIIPTSYSVHENNKIRIIDSVISKNLIVKNGWKKGRIFTSAKPVLLSSQKNDIIKKCNPYAVDMEAFVIADVCKRECVKFASLKIISDLADFKSVSKFKNKIKKIRNILPEYVRYFIKLNRVYLKKL